MFDQTHSEEPQVIGGLAAGLPGAVIHNYRDAAVWPVFCEGVEAYPGITPHYKSRSGIEGRQRKIGNFASMLLHA